MPAAHQRPVGSFSAAYYANRVHTGWNYLMSEPGSYGDTVLATSCDKADIIAADHRGDENIAVGAIIAQIAIGIH